MKWFLRLKVSDVWHDQFCQYVVAWIKDGYLNESANGVVLTEAGQEVFKYQRRKPTTGERCNRCRGMERRAG